MRLYYRGMVEENGKPRVGRSARLLCVRPGTDIDAAHIPRGWLDSRGCLRSESERIDSDQLVEVAVRNVKGMSTSLSIGRLPPFRRPVEFGGIGRDPLWRVESEYITGDLEAVQDSDTHVSIMPRVAMLLERYEAALAKTQDYWKKVIKDGMGV